MLRRFSVNFAILSMAVDAALAASMLLITARLRPLMGTLPFVQPVPSPVLMPASLYLIFPLIWVLVLASFAIYDGKKFIRAADEFAMLLMASILSGVSQAGVLYFSYRDVSRALFLVYFILCCLSFLSWRALARLLFRLRRNREATTRRVLIVGTGPIGRMVEERLKKNQAFDLALVGFVDDQPAESFAGEILGRTDEIRSLVERQAVTDVIVALPPHFYDQMRQATARLNESPVRVWIALGFFDLALYTTAMEDFEGLPLLNLRASALDDYERLIKRAFDLAFAASLLLVSWPILAVSALLIWMDDGRPILFRQIRVGENGQLFEIYKFRSMVRNAEMLHAAGQPHADGSLVVKSKGDPRVTRIGRLLRRLSIDELPQLFNVLRGEMSLVGPRPELAPVVEQYEPWQRQRLAVPPGITGWWQITGRADKPLHLNTEDDLYYIHNYSIWLDLKIIARTAWVVLLGRGAY
jgi:exopolysaccharide biosynthesis polyprenyl glycosylphosphotransferase